MTRTLIVSDLHLGGLSGIDLLRRPELRAALLDELDGIDRLVLLGDVLELRHGPPHDALLAARSFFEDVGRALGGDRELIVTAGNHDHLMVSTWLDARALREPSPESLGVEQRFDPAEASPMLAQIARWASPARVTVAYPGLWVRPDVYATHGHFLDAHLTVPTLERIGVGVMGRLLERPPGTLDSAEGYESVTAPIYAWRDAITRYAAAGPVLNGLATARAWRALGGGWRRGDGGRRNRREREGGGRLRAGQADRALSARRGEQSRDQARVSPDGWRAQPSRPGSGERRHLPHRAAPLGAARDRRGCGAVGPRRRPRRLRPHPPRGALSGGPGI